MFNNNDDDFNKKEPEKDKTPPEGLILFLMIGIMVGATLIMNFLVYIFMQNF